MSLLSAQAADSSESITPVFAGMELSPSESSFWPVFSEFEREQGLPFLDRLCSSGDADLDGDTNRTPLDLLRSRDVVVLPLMEPELDFRIFGMELGPGDGVIEVRGD